MTRVKDLSLQSLVHIAQKMAAHLVENLTDCCQRDTPFTFFLGHLDRSALMDEVLKRWHHLLAHKGWLWLVLFRIRIFFKACLDVLEFLVSGKLVTFFVNALQETICAGV